MTTSHLKTRRAMLASLTVAASLLAFCTFASAASADVEWSSEVFQSATNLPPGGQGIIKVLGANNGDSSSSGYPSISFDLPPGVTVAPGHQNNLWECTGVGTPQVVTCTFALSFFSVGPEQFIGVFGSPTYVNLIVDVDADAPEGIAPLGVTISGGGDTASQSHTVRIGAEQLGFGTVPGSFVAGAFDDAGQPYTQAGGHPYEATTSFALNQKYEAPTPGSDVSYAEANVPVAKIKDVVVDLPAGFAGDPTSGPRCPNLGLIGKYGCPSDSQVGVATISPPVAARATRRMSGIYNVVPDRDTPAQFAFLTPVGTVVLTPVVRSDGDFGLSVQVKGITQADAIFSNQVTLWGVPADPRHDALRCPLPNFHAQACVGFDESGQPVPNGEAADAMFPHSTDAPLKPFLSNPTECTGAPALTALHLTSWVAPGSYEADGDPNLSDPNWFTENTEVPPVTGCEALDFSPSLVARPTTNAADSPTGLDFDLHLPQNEDPEGLATAHLEDTKVTLPPGLVINPSGANGLGACSPAQIGLTSAVGNGDPVFDKADPTCPLASRVGSVQVYTPVLEDPLHGSVYVATPQQNPFGSLLSLYVVLKGPGLIVKLAGKVTPDPQTGQLTAVFDDNPQVPFEDFHLNFFGGAAASLKTPSTCGTYSTTSSLTPWSAPQSGPPATPSDTWAIASAPGGGACGSSEAQLPNAPSFEAGSTNPLAGNYSPFVLNLRREDGTQQFSQITVKPPAGLVAKLAGTPACSEAALAQAAAKSGNQEQSVPSCPASSQVGNVIAGAGAGPAPYYAPGKAYLAGPYKGAPLSLAIITPAVAGPFDLGTIVVRAALHLDPKTAEITAISDPIPTILQGIPLDLRSISVRLDKPSFTLNPTSCDPTAVSGTLLSPTGQSAALNNRFQLAECDQLHFKPKLALFLKGGSKRSDFPALTAVLKPRPGDANIASVALAMPPSEFLAQQHIRTVCTRVQFAADQCPKASIYGTATVSTPLLDYKLSGPVYLRSSDNPLPDLVPDLRGPAYQPIKLEAAGRTDSVNNGIRNTFDFVPDAPFTKLVLRMQGGKKGLLENSRDICAEPYRAKVSFGAHNGASYTARPVLRARCGKGRGGKGDKGKRGKHRG